MVDSRKINEFLIEKLRNSFFLIDKINEKPEEQEFTLQMPLTFMACGKFLRAEFEVPHEMFPADLIKWLSLQEIAKKMYWSERDASYEVAGLGHADIILANADLFDKINERLGIRNSAGSLFRQSRSSNPDLTIRCLPVRYYGAIAFNPGDKIDEEWKVFGNSYFFVPMLEFINSGGKKIFAANIFAEDTTNLNNSKVKDIAATAIGLIEKLNFNSVNAVSGSNTATVKTGFKLQVKRRIDNPLRRNWIKNINNVIKAFGNIRLEKIVLSRKTVFKTASPINPFELLDALRKVNIRTFNFCFQGDPHNAFLGCSPELLYSRKDGRLYSEAVAGTVVSGNTLKEEKLFASKLLQSEKDGEEYQFVYDCIKKDLNSIGIVFKVESEKEILKLSYAQHIISRFDCNLKNGTDDSQIINTLHPTPAVGGFPKKDIKQHIKRYERFSRGFYSGPVGWISADSAEFVVGIRSGLVNNNILILYSGAGIVKKSVAEMEWEEIENKIKPFLGLMQF
jgi:menaquinone-specific isochorismate synthase